MGRIIQHISWLHLSDLHVDTRLGDNTRSGREQERCWSALEKDITDVCGDTTQYEGLRTPDFIVLSGDIVKKGANQDSFELAHKCLARLCAAADVPPERVFVIPGNHDVNRRRFPQNHRELLLELLRSDIPKFRQTVDSMWESAATLEKIGRKFEAYKDFAEHYASVRQVAPNSWYSTIEVNSAIVRIIGLNSVWTGGDRELDHITLPVVGSGQRDSIEEGLQSERTPDLTLVLQHNPTSYLHWVDSSEHCQWLDEHDAIVFSGHLHDSDLTEHRSVRGRHIELLGGALYVDYERTRRYSFGTIKLTGNERQYTVALRAAEPRREFFARDTHRYPSAREGVVTFSQGVDNPNLGAQIKRQDQLEIDCERAFLRYDADRYEIRIEKTYTNPTMRTWTHIDALILANAFPDDPVRSRELYREHPVELDEIGFYAKCDGRGVTWTVLNDLDSRKDLLIVLGEGGEQNGGIGPGEKATLEYGFHIDRRYWGPYFERHIRRVTKRIECTLDFPADCLKHMSLVRNPRITATPINDEMHCDANDKRVVYQWDHDKPPLQSRYRFSWELRD